MSDEWVPVPHFHGYSVNRLGQVRQDESGRILHIRLNQDGVPYVGMMRDGMQCSRSLARLVASVFITQPNPVFDTPITLDGDRTNCHVENLAWRPRWYARRYAAQFEERYPNPILVPIRAIDEPDVFPDSLSAACFYGLLEREVVLSVLNRTYTWPTYQEFELATVA